MIFLFTLCMIKLITAYLLCAREKIMHFFFEFDACIMHSLKMHQNYHFWGSQFTRKSKYAVINLYSITSCYV